MRLRFTAVFALGCLAAGASAQVLVQDNFDSYTTGSLLNSHAPWDATGSSNYLISTDHALSGTRSAKVVGQGVLGSTDFAWINLNGGNNFTYSPSASKVTGAVSLWMNSGLAATDWLGFVVFDQSVNRIAGIRYNGAGDLQFWSGANWISSGDIAPMNQWVSLQVQANYTSATTGNIKYLVNNIEFAPFQVNYASGFGLSDFNLYQFGNSTGYFDNYSVSAVPEPATLAVLGLGILATRRRRKQG